MIRHATIHDLPAIKVIADANKDTLGFVMRPALQLAIEKRWLLVAEQNATIAGFVNYRHRRNQQCTIYEICVAQQWRGKSIGRLLIEALREEAEQQGKCFIQLKAIAGISSNGFYEQLGFHCIGTEQGKQKQLNVWRYELDAHLLCSRESSTC